jgi:hypothetical protein
MNGRRVPHSLRHSVATVLVAAGGLPFAAGGATALAAQLPDFSGYYQNVGVGTAASPGVGAAALDAQRARLMWTPSAGDWSLDAAYEHTLWWRSSANAGVGGGLLSSTGSGEDWLHLGWTVHDGDRVHWRQRFDRLSLSYTHGAVTATVGRQAVSWATTLFLTPADPFVPFDPSDPFREYRSGIDAARVQWFAGAFTTLDFVVRPADTPDGRTLSALARARTTVSGWELSAWGGAIHDAPGGAFGLTRTVAGSAVRAEAEVRRDTAGGTAARFAAGVDRRFSILDRDLYAVVEYQHDPFGAARATDLGAVAVSQAAGRRELQVLGRDESAVQLTYQAHPLVSAELLALWNLRDGSALMAPAAAISLSNESSIRLGVYLPAGPRYALFGAPGSEYGPLPVTGYAALSIFF